MARVDKSNNDSLLQRVPESQLEPHQVARYKRRKYAPFRLSEEI